MGTTSDWHNPVLDSHETQEQDDALICREAYTPASARAVRDHFVTDCGTASGDGKSNQDGKLVYAYKKSVPRQPDAAQSHFSLVRHS